MECVAHSVAAGGATDAVEVAVPPAQDQDVTVTAAYVPPKYMHPSFRPHAALLH